MNSMNYIDLATWQSSKDHVEWMRVQLRDPMFQSFLTVLQTHAVSVAGPGVNGSGDFHHGKQFGKSEMLAVINMMSIIPQKQEDIPATYERQDEQG